MQIKLWGVRGSISSPMTNDEYSEKIRRVIESALKAEINENSNINQFIQSLPDDLKYVYGGNTTCASLTSNSGIMYILDCGTGLRPLGYELMKGPCKNGKGVINIFMTHNHWDHIQGLPFFTPLYVKGNILNFYSPFKNQMEFLNDQMQAPYFPAVFNKTESTKKYIKLDAKKRTPAQLEDDLIVDFYPLKHPGGSFAYRFKQAGKIFIFATDAEFTGEILERGGQQEDDFFAGADLLIIDSQYTLDESFSKFDWGHTSYTMAVNCGIRWKIKELVLTHHEPSYTDTVLYGNYLSALEHSDNCKNDSMKIHMATEGTIYKL
jgi:phosphoribosyl 1,2-cyclic phosphodiesterase